METVTTQDVSLNDLPWVLDYRPERCTLCGSCVAACTVDAISFSRARSGGSTRKAGGDEAKAPTPRLVVRQSTVLEQACMGCGM